jgi:hypothetical protein
MRRPVRGMFVVTTIAAALAGAAGSHAAARSDDAAQGIEVTVTNATARLTGSGAGGVALLSGVYEQSGSFDGSVTQRDAIMQSVADGTPAIELTLPVRFDGLPTARTAWSTTYGCEEGGTNPTLGDTTVLVPAPGGTGDAEIAIRVELEGGRPVGLEVLDDGAAHTVIREVPGALLATWATTVTNCDHTSSSSERVLPVHHGSYLIPSAFSP